MRNPTPYLMEVVEGSIETGAVYQHVRQLPVGPYTHRFHFRDAELTELFWPNLDGNPGPSVTALEPLQVMCWSDPSHILF